MEIVEVIEIINECKNIKTIKFNFNADALPGQFVMVWLPGIDEIPMSISLIGKTNAITADKVGAATEAIHALSPGDKIGIRGPYGNGFKITGSNLLVVGGGTGMAPLAPLVEHAIAHGCTVTAAIGAQSQCGILFADRLAKAGAGVRLASDDGSTGFHGFVTEVAEELMKSHDYDQIFACGPEAMLVKIVELAKQNNISIQCSLERYMKCGIGICGSCQLGKFTVCKDGPVFDGETLSRINDFGKFKRDASGKKIDL